jgi:hypothetical protein
MQRMNLANVLRSTFLNGGDIYILGKQYNVTHMRDDYNGEIENNDKSIAKFAETNDLGTSPRVIKALRKTLFEAAEKAKAEEAKEAKKTDAEAKAKKKADAEKAKADKAAKEGRRQGESQEEGRRRQGQGEGQEGQGRRQGGCKAAKPAKAAAPAKAEKVKEPA